MKLNLGAGKWDIREGYINLDIINYPGIDVVWDLNKLPLPFDNCQFDEILALNILEHIEYVPLMDELYRILKPGGVIKIRVPHVTSIEAYTDPTHIKKFSFFTFSYFVKGGVREYPFMKFSKFKGRMTFQKRPLLFWNYFFEWWVNLHSWTVKLYEKTPLRIFPAANLEDELIK